MSRFWEALEKCAKAHGGEIIEYSWQDIEDGESFYHVWIREPRKDDDSNKWFDSLSERKD